MTPAELKSLYEENEEGRALFFTRETMRFFGDTMTNYKVSRVTVIDKYGEKPTQQDAYKLFRKQPVKHGLDSPAFFSLQGKQLCGVKEI